MYVLSYLRETTSTLQAFNKSVDSIHKIIRLIIWWSLIRRLNCYQLITMRYLNGKQLA